MAIPLKFYSIIIPAEKVKKALPFSEYIEMLLEARKNGQILYDGKLFCEQTMSPVDCEEIIKYWEQKGLTPTGNMGRKLYWKDLCLVEFPDDKPTLPCNWIKIFNKANNVFAKIKE